MTRKKSNVKALALAVTCAILAGGGIGLEPVYAATPIYHDVVKYDSANRTLDYEFDDGAGTGTAAIQKINFGNIVLDGSSGAGTITATSLKLNGIGDIKTAIEGKAAQADVENNKNNIANLQTKTTKISYNATTGTTVEGAITATGNITANGGLSAANGRFTVKASGETVFNDETDLNKTTTIKAGETVVKGANGKVTINNSGINIAQKELGTNKDLSITLDSGYVDASGYVKAPKFIIDNDNGFVKEADGKSRLTVSDVDETGAVTNSVKIGGGNILASGDVNVAGTLCTNTILNATHGEGVTVDGVKFKAGAVSGISDINDGIIKFTKNGTENIVQINSDLMFNDESKTTQKENKDLLQGKTVPPVGQLDHSDLTTNKITEKSVLKKSSMVNPIEKTEDKVEKMNTQYTVTYGPGLAYVGNSTTVNISFKQNNKKVNVPADTTFELAGNSAKGATVDKTTGKISYTPDPQEFKNVEKEKNVTVNVKITYKDQSTSTVSATITVRKEESAVPKINPVVEGQTKITGIGVKGAKIEIEIEKKLNDGKSVGGATVQDNGTWEVVVEKDSIKEGYKVRAIQTEENKSSTATFTIVSAKKEQDKQKPDAGKQKPQDNGAETPQEKSETPTVNSVTEGDTTISGTGKAGAKIHVTSPKGLIIGENIKVNNEGKWTLNIPKGIELKKGDAVLVVQQEEGKDISKQVSSVVTEKKLDKQTEQTQVPTLNKINEKSTTISGTGKAGAKIFLKGKNGVMWPINLLSINLRKVNLLT